MTAKGADADPGTRSKPRTRLANRISGMRYQLCWPLLAAACLAYALNASPASAATQVAEGSCQGEVACVGNSGHVAENACNGRRACAVNSGNIASDACNGPRACNNNSADIAQNSCNGDNACVLKVGDVAANSCNGGLACNNNTGGVAENAWKQTNRAVDDCLRRDFATGQNIVAQRNFFDFKMI